MHHFRQALYAMALFVIAFSVSADSVHAQVQMKVNFQDMDQNRDGGVSRNAQRLYSDSFLDCYDSNNKGVLSRNEVNEMRMGARWNQQDERWNTSNDNWKIEAQRRYIAFDYNRDGVVSRNEWQGSNENFFRLDNKNDGMLSQSELFSRPEVWTTVVQVTTSDPFRMRDRNNDTEISRSEWDGSNWEFDSLDKDHNGNLNIEEFHEPTSSDTFRSFDHNNDGFISREEWHYAADSFAALDRNSNGRLDRDEFYNRTQVRVAVFSELDVNNNGTISRSEWRSDNSAFNVLDTNGDNVLTEGEFYSQTSSNGTSTQQVIEQIFQQVFKNR